MSRHYEHSHTLADGRTIEFSFVVKSGFYRARFIGPDGKRQEKSTGRKKKGEALEEAKNIIEKAFAPPAAEVTTISGWDTALADLDATPDLRPESIKAYRKAAGAVRRLFPELAGPADVTPEIAQRFKRHYMSGTFVRAKATNAKRYKRSAETCKSALRALRSLWKKHLKPLGHVSSNPWLDVEYPNAPRGRRVRVPSEESIQAFFRWLTEKYPAWELPRLFVTVKMLAGCRTLDLCKVRTFDFKGTVITLTAEATKNRAARTVDLPDDVAADLRKHAGATWLWDRSVEETKQHRPSNKMKAKTEYDPKTWGHIVQNLFREFNKGKPREERLRPHDLRARAITRVAKRTQSVDLTAQAMGVAPQTARHYLESEKAFDGPATLKEAADDLRVQPAKAPTSSEK